MPSAADFVARGKVTAVRDNNVVVFQPANTNYELHLAARGGSRYDGPVNTLVEGRVRLGARKVLTVPSGGNFIEPIFGHPRTIQGRVRHLEDRTLVVQAGAPLIVELPAAETALDLTNGPITAGSLVNVMVLPGATFELVGAPVAR
jgi:hypothetical protein